MLLFLLGGLCEADLPGLGEFLTNVMLLLLSVSYFSYCVFNLDSSSGNTWLLNVDFSLDIPFSCSRNMSNQFLLNNLMSLWYQLKRMS